ncbi:MAG: polysaccharide deacetylase family protein [Calothrix sp. MO_167.B42]|nr:polysaccharide deacetylase family protein [Calothrix sp. MO_167.B42]
MTDNYWGRSRNTIISLTIAATMTACNAKPVPTTSQLNSNSTQKVPPVTEPIHKSKTAIQNRNFSVPIKFQGKIVYRVEVPQQEKVIALTIDDGPWKPTTTQMLDILKQNNVKATFFWVGKTVQAHPQIAKEVVAQGHAIGNHTWNHHYHRVTPAVAKDEIERTAEIIYQTTGVRTYLFRPPGGYLNNGLAAYAKSQKYSVLMWSQTSADTDPRAKYQVFVKNVLRDAKPGGIVLMHDGGGNRSRTVKALPEMIKGLKQKGYRFVTIPELLQMSP